MKLNLILIWYQVKSVPGIELWALANRAKSKTETTSLIWGVDCGRPTFLVMYPSYNTILSAHLCCCLAFVLLTNSHIKKYWRLTEWLINGSFDVLWWSKNNEKVSFVCRTVAFY